VAVAAVPMPMEQTVQVEQAVVEMLETQPHLEQLTQAEEEAGQEQVLVQAALA